MATGFQPRRGCVGSLFTHEWICDALAQPRWGWIARSSFPRVAAKARQPWAVRRYRFAVNRLISEVTEFPVIAALSDQRRGDQSRTIF